MIISYIINLIMGLMSGILLYACQNLHKQNKKYKDEKAAKQVAMSNGIKELLRINLIDYHDKYIKQEEIPYYAYENFNRMYEAYKGLGGNGSITQMKNEIDELHILKN